MNNDIKYNQIAVAGVIEALLIVALVAIVLSVIQIVYIPEIMEQRESDHMDEIENQFSYLKSMIDIQSATGENMPISSPINLGSKELPYFVSARAFGQLDIIDSDYTNSKININPNPAPLDYPNGFPITSIRYDSINSYFLDQTYILEGGGLIIYQYEGETSRINPAIIITNKSTYIDIYYKLPILKGEPGKNSSSGYKICFIRTNYSKNSTYYTEIKSGFNEYIRFYSDYLDAWNQTFNKLLYEEIKNGYITVEKLPAVSPEYVQIKPGSKDIHLEIEIVNIGAQIGPGIIDS